MKKFIKLFILVLIIIVTIPVLANEKTCNMYASEGKETCEAAVYKGYKCEWDRKLKGASRCKQSDNLAEEVKKTITACDQISEEETCRYSKIDGHECIWRQGACYSNTIVDDGTDDTIIADDQEDRDGKETEIGNIDSTIDYDELYGNVSTATTSCSTLGILRKDLKGIFSVFKIVAPILVVVMSTYDFIKTLIGKVDGEAKKAFIRFIKRLIFALILFFLPTILDFFLGLIDPNYSTCINS